jgi:hypothetical protein
VYDSLCTPKRSLVSELTAAKLQSIGVLLRWSKDATTRTVIPCDHEWHCEEEDAIPTLADVFEQVPEVRDCRTQHILRLQKAASMVHITLKPLPRTSPGPAVLANLL